MNDHQLAHVYTMIAYKAAVDAEAGYPAVPYRGTRRWNLSKHTLANEQIAFDAARAADVAIGKESPE